MKILVTGSKGFIGRHIVKALEKNNVIFEYDIDNSLEDLNNYILQADFVIHLAGINRPKNTNEFYEGNTNFTKLLVDLILKNKRFDLPIIMSSSIQATLDNDYGKSKLEAEEYIINSKLPNYIFRLNNVFGKWCRPNYNNVFATFSYNISHGLDILINNPNNIVTFNYIDDVVLEFSRILSLKEHNHTDKRFYVEPSYKISVNNLAKLIRYFDNCVKSDIHLPLIKNDFEYKAFKTYLYYLNDNKYPLNYFEDNRGSFEELYKDELYGQISENVINENITKGGHYHTYKKEIFYVVLGKCKIVQENIYNNDIIDNIVDGKDLKKVDILPYYSHSISNIGENKSHVFMWINKIYNEESSDTFVYKK